jgi:hypothetical protein
MNFSKSLCSSVQHHRQNDDRLAFDNRPLSDDRTVRSFLVTSMLHIVGQHDNICRITAGVFCDSDSACMSKIFYFYCFLWPPRLCLGDYASLALWVWPRFLTNSSTSVHWMKNLMSVTYHDTLSHVVEPWLACWHQPSG